MPLKRAFLCCLLALLLLPALQAEFHLVELNPLGGNEDVVPFPAFSKEALIDNTFQPAMERYADFRLGFRPWLVRLYSQMRFSVFNKTPNTICIGHDQQLYQFAAINSYLGRDFLGNDEISLRLRQLRRVQDTLRAHGTQLLVVLAPGKARILPEFLPDSIQQVLPSNPSNLDVLARRLPEAGIPVLNAGQLLLRWKDTTRYPLFPRTGTHWSGYAVSLLADTLFRRAEALTNRDLPDFHLQKGVVGTRIQDLRYTDNDLGSLLNLVKDIQPHPMYYPEVVFEPTTSKHPLDALIIGDSFAQSLYGFYPFYDKLLAPRSRFWSYNQNIYWPEHAPEGWNVHELNLREQYAGRDLVILLATEQNLTQFGFGFIDDAFDLYVPRTAKDTLRTQELEKQILASPDWADQIARKAAEQNRDLFETIHAEAQYISDRER
ncbi:alginate O-acetyltransferase AlgX-related protein [Hymenobacter sp.]|jgi:hypothetical protein|uniref:alginate O-acetyltransferase AlgX-related protein n=1 Tax=Hymenobacter sp. TaxID=1898978 RepID=UPI002ED929C7